MVLKLFSVHSHLQFLLSTFTVSVRLLSSIYLLHLSHLSFRYQWYSGTYLSFYSPFEHFVSSRRYTIIKETIIQEPAATGRETCTWTPTRLHRLTPRAPLQTQPVRDSKDSIDIYQLTVSITWFALLSLMPLFTMVLHH